MFDYVVPVYAAQRQREFMEDFGSLVPADQKAKLRELNAAVSPVETLLGGMEVLFVLALEIPLATEPARDAVMQTLGTVATSVATHQFGGPDTRDRAWAMTAWAAHQIDPVGTPPPQPDVLPQYTTMEPEAPPPPND